ncbi:hypothetical protein OAU81_00485 [bacterium]|nr:hypothetical protein [bacterium]
MSENFNTYISGKRVAVVGPAGHVSEYKHRDLIESYDIVMRFNSILPIHDDLIPNIGVRTDILCNGLDNNPISCGEYNSKLWKKLGVKWVFCPYWPHLNYQRQCVKNWNQHNNGLIPTHCTDERSFRRVNDVMNTRPNTGLLGVMYLLHHGIKEMFLTGISFGLGKQYHSGYKSKYNSYSSEASKLHNQRIQFIYFKEQYQKYKDIINVDSTLKELLLYK